MTCRRRSSWAAAGSLRMSTCLMPAQFGASQPQLKTMRAGSILPLFLGQMCCPCGIDIAGPLPAVVHLMQAAAQCPGADRDTMALLRNSQAPPLDGRVELPKQQVTENRWAASD